MHLELAHQDAMAVNALLSTVLPLPLLSTEAGVARRLSADAPANSNDPPAISMAASVSAVSATCLAEYAAAAEDLEDEEVVVEVEGAETTNHLTDPPRRAASMEVISPIPPGGEMTTTSAAAVEEDDDVANNCGRI